MENPYKFLKNEGTFSDVYNKILNRTLFNENEKIFY